MTDIQPVGLSDVKEIKGTFCFYSKHRGAEYDHMMVNKENQAVMVNYHGPMLSDGTPGSIVNNEIHRPDDYKSYSLVGAEKNLREATKQEVEKKNLNNNLDSLEDLGIMRVKQLDSSGQPMRHTRALIMPNGQMMQFGRRA